VVTAILPSEDTGLSAAVALAMDAATVVVTVVVTVVEEASDEALVPGLAGAEVSAEADITLTGEDRMDPLTGPHTLALIPQAPRMSSLCSRRRLK
jgi:hypothetical protein